MKTRLFAALLLGFLLHAPDALAIGAVWATGDSGTKTATGTLGPVAVSVTNLTGASKGSADFSTADYSAAPLSMTESAMNYGVGSRYTTTFSLPVSGLMIYAQFWRGNGSGTTGDVLYMFNHPVTILSGFPGCSTSGNTLSVPNTGFVSGIIRFEEPVSMLSLVMNTASTQGQVFSFGVLPRATTVAITGSLKPKTKGKTYTLRGTADATYGIQAVKIKVGKGKKLFTAKGTAQWTYRVKLAPGRTKLQIQAISNTGESSAIQRVTILKTK